MNMQTNELKHIVEAAILVADDPISVNRLISLFPEGAKPEKQDILNAIEELSSDCEQRGIELKKVGAGFRYQSKERYAEFLRKLYELKPPRYSRAVLETLSIIAYRQPVTRGDIEDVRGVSVSTEIMRTLLNRQWVKEVGFKEVPGRPALYATTKEFLAYFNLKTIREMPELQQKRELEEIAKDNQINLPLEQLSSDQAIAEGVSVDDADGDNVDAKVVELQADDTLATAVALDVADDATVKGNEDTDHGEATSADDDAVDNVSVEPEPIDDGVVDNKSVEAESAEDEAIDDKSIGVESIDGEAVDNELVEVEAAEDEAIDTKEYKEVSA